MAVPQYDVIVVGAGILGLAHAYAAARRGLRVAVFERSARASGASVRNFGMVWPIGQPAGRMHELAMRSREVWLELLTAAGLPYQNTGSLHLAYHADEEAVAREFAEAGPARGYECAWRNAAEVLAVSQAACPTGCAARCGARWNSPSIRGWC